MRTREKRIGIRALKATLSECVREGKAGRIAWSGRRLRPARPAGKVRGTKTVADLIVEDRK